MRLLRSRAAATPKVERAALSQGRRTLHRFRVIEVFAKKKENFLFLFFKNNLCLSGSTSPTLECLGLVNSDEQNLPRLSACNLQLHFAVI